MSISLEKFVGHVSDFRTLSDPEKIKHFAWFAHRSLKHDRVTTGDIRSCYDALHIDRPNITENLKRLNDRRVLLKDGRGYFLEGKVREELDGLYLKLVEDPVVEVGDLILPDAMIKGTKPYIEKLGWQINGCYQYKFYDGFAVLMRRLMESLLIEAFSKAAHDDKIRIGGNGDYQMLAKIIEIARGGQYIRLARGSDKICDDVKYVGDRSAHSRSYVSTPNDVTDLILRFRTIVAELLHLADIHPARP